MMLDRSRRLNTILSVSLLTWVKLALISVNDTLEMVETTQFNLSVYTAGTKRRSSLRTRRLTEKKVYSSERFTLR